MFLLTFEICFNSKVTISLKNPVWYQEFNSWVSTVLLAHLFVRFVWYIPLVINPCTIIKHNMLCDIQVTVPTVACPNECLHMVVTSAINENSADTRLVYFDGAETSIVINTTELPAGEWYHSNFSIKDGSGVVVDVENTTISFSECNMVL